MNEHLPTPRTVVQLPDGTHAYIDPHALPQQTGPQVVHIHQAAPDRTVQRIALGSGMGAGTVAAGVYFGPLLVGALTAIAATLAILAFLAVALTWGVVTLVRSVGGADGKAAAKNVRKARRR
ncbi:DUF6251 family protein [Streptomyces niveus]|uniref:DUF6251 family protein n=1 Tax=Streptomyces niveus TaxID=193462 RepID=UPI0036D3E181